MDNSKKPPMMLKVLVKTLHAVDFVRTFHRPVVMPDKRGSQRVESHERSRGTRERADSDRECYRKKAYLLILSCSRRPLIVVAKLSNVYAYDDGGGASL